MADTPKRILVAEDNDVLANVIRFNLEQAGLSVSVARDGTEAIELLRDLPFDMLIADYQMPTMGGEALYQYIRQTLGLVDLPIIVCSAKGFELDSDYLRSRWNVQRLIFKPFSMREILRLVRTLTSPPLDAKT